jgi:hypothetical protein
MIFQVVFRVQHTITPIVFLCFGCSSPSGSEAKPTLSPPGIGHDGYRMVIGTVIEIATGEAASGWRLSVDHGGGVHSGPPMPEHFCQWHDDPDGEFRMVVAPTWVRGSTDLESLALKIESTNPRRPDYRATFFVTREMWKNGTWRQPRCGFWWYKDESGIHGGGNTTEDSSGRPSPFRARYRVELHGS